MENRQLTIGNQETHPLPRGGTDLIQVQAVFYYLDKVLL
jgi:hypothetical protein